MQLALAFLSQIFKMIQRIHTQLMIFGLPLISTAFLSCLYLDKISTNDSIHSLIFFVFLQSLTTSRGKLGTILKSAIATLLALSISITYACHFVYAEGFNIAFATSVLDTTTAEVRMMYTLFSAFILLAVLLFCFQFFAHESFRKFTGTKRRSFTAILLIYAVASIFYIANEDVKFGVSENNFASYLDRTPFYNLAFFLRARDEQTRMKALSGATFTHTYRPTAHTYDEVVVVVGESARRGKLHAYGYDRNTTPALDSQLNHNVTLFTNAVAGAPYTLLAVPLSLTSAMNADKDSPLMFDSIINAAKANHIQTNWISTQGNWGDDSFGVAAIANKSHSVQWIGGPDENVLTPLHDTLGKQGRKLIVVHINGSHEPACSRLPDSDYAFGEKTEDDCYDSTVRYTDILLGKIFAALQGHNAALVYYSDHGLIKNEHGNYIHASGIPPKKAVEVPMLVWFAHGRPAWAKPRITGLYSTEDNYYLIADLLGVEVDGKPCRSALNSCYDFRRSPIVTDTSGEDHLYTSLRD